MAEIQESPLSTFNPVMTDQLKTPIDGGVDRADSPTTNSFGLNPEDFKKMPFPYKLYDLLFNEPSDIVKWINDGQAFKITDMSKFSTVTSPKYFKHTKMESFQRQLNLYGFRRVLKGDEEGAYYHPQFQKGRVDLLSKIKRVYNKSQHSEPTWPEYVNRSPGYDHGVPSTVTTYDPASRSSSMSNYTTTSNGSATSAMMVLQSAAAMLAEESIHSYSTRPSMIPTNITSSRMKNNMKREASFSIEDNTMKSGNKRMTINIPTSSPLLSHIHPDSPSLQQHYSLDLLSNVLFSNPHYMSSHINNTTTNTPSTHSGISSSNSSSSTSSTSTNSYSQDTSHETTSPSRVSTATNAMTTMITPTQIPSTLMDKLSPMNSNNNHNHHHHHPYTTTTVPTWAPSPMYATPYPYPYYPYPTGMMYPAPYSTCALSPTSYTNIMNKEMKNNVFFGNNVVNTNNPHHSLNRHPNTPTNGLINNNNEDKSMYELFKRNPEMFLPSYMFNPTTTTNANAMNSMASMTSAAAIAATTADYMSMSNTLHSSASTPTSNTTTTGYMNHHPISFFPAPSNSSRSTMMKVPSSITTTTTNTNNNTNRSEKKSTTNNTTTTTTTTTMNVNKLTESQMKSNNCNNNSNSNSSSTTTNVTMHDRMTNYLDEVDDEDDNDHHHTSSSSNQSQGNSKYLKTSTKTTYRNTGGGHSIIQSIQYDDNKEVEEDDEEEDFNETTSAESNSIVNDISIHT